MKTNCKFLIFITLASILIMPTRIYAQTNNQFRLGSNNPTVTNSKGERLLDIWLLGNYSAAVNNVFVISKYNETLTAYETPFYDRMAPLNIRIENTYSEEFTVYTSYTTGSVSYPPTPYPTQLAVQDAGSSISSSPEYVIKRYTGYYDYDDYRYNNTGVGVDLSGRYTFTIDWRIDYNWEDPNKVMQTVTITNNIPAAADVKITLAHGHAVLFEYGTTAIVTSPNIMRNSNYLNGSGVDYDYTITKNEVRSLAFIGTADVTGVSNTLGYYPVGRPFDVAYGTRVSGGNDDISQYLNYVNELGDVLNYYEYDTSTATADAQDIIVGYYIPLETTHTVQTGIMFTDNLPVELDYTWRNNTTSATAKHLTVPMNTPVSLSMAVHNFNKMVINDIGFRVNMPSTPTTIPIALPITGGAPAVPTGFTSSTPSGDATFYQIANATMPAAPNIQPFFTTATALVPVSTAMYGEWTIDYTTIPDGYLSNIMPVVGQLPAVLTVTTTAGYDQAGNISIAAGTTKQITVKLAGNLTAHRDIVVTLTASVISGTWSTPTTITMTIPSGQNSGTFPVTATSTDGDAVVITITGIDYAPVLIDNSKKTVTLTVEPEIHYIPVNPHLMSKIIIP